jgi:hypothetical protein
MLTCQNIMGVEVIRGACDIAWDYLDRIGAIGDREKAHDELLAGLLEMHNNGIRNKLVTANKAISAFQRTPAAA